MNDTKTFLEKYEPKRLDDVVGQTTIIKIIRGYIKSNNIPHLMFAGEPGIGKTVLSNVIARELFGENYKSNMISLNASSDRGIDIIRGKVKESTKFSPLSGHDFKIIFMDEADFLTEPAQRALRDIVVKHQSITRFIFAVNDLSKMITPLQDRAQVFKFKRLKTSDIQWHLNNICNSENIEDLSQYTFLIAELANGSMRKAVNCLQSISTQSEINELIIKELMGSSLNDKNINELLDLIKTGNVEKYEKFLFQLVYNEGYNPSEIMNSIIDLLIKRNDNTMLPIVVGLSEYDWRMSQGANPMLQLRCGLMKLSQTGV